MSTEDKLDITTSDWQWFVVGRWQEFAGEARANLLRIVAVGGFYSVELVRYYFIVEGTEADIAFHRSATAVAVAWTLLALGVLICLRRQIFPPALKFVSTAVDITLLTCLAISVTGSTNGIASPPVFIYFLIIALAALRFNLPLVWMATLGSMAGYMAFVAVADRRSGSQWFDADHAVPVVEQLMMLLALGLTGVIVGQIIRRVRAVSEEFKQRMEAAKQAES